jgi:hypothetical protein
MIVKFPYSASRRVYSRRGRVSKNGTPEERAAKAAATAAELTSAAVTEISSRSGDLHRGIGGGMYTRKAYATREASWRGPAMTNQRLAKAVEAGPRAPTIVEFIQQLRSYLVEEFARGRDIDQIFGDLEENYRRVEKALGKS